MTLDDNSLLYYLLHGVRSPSQRVAQGFNQFSPANSYVANNWPTPNDQVAARFGGMNDPDANLAVAARFGGMAPPSTFMPSGGPGTFPVPGNSGPTPNQYVGNNFGGMAAPSGVPWWANAQGANFGAQAPSPATAGGGQVPMPMARPAVAPQAPPAPQMSWFQRNAAMQRDPQTGAFLDPSAAAAAQAQMGAQPSLIKKFSDLLFKHASNSDDTNDYNSDAAT